MCNESKIRERKLLLRVFTEEVKGSDSTMKHILLNLTTYAEGILPIVNFILVGKTSPYQQELERRVP